MALHSPTPIEDLKDCPFAHSWTVYVWRIEQAHREEVSRLKRRRRDLWTDFVIFAILTFLVLLSLAR